MIRLKRPELETTTTTVLRRRQEGVDESVNPKSEAKRSWATFAGNARQDVVAKLEVMASGLSRCMYCEDSMGTDVDHFRPKSDYPAFAFVWQNYYLACSHCNSNAKRNEFPVDKDGERLLIDPTEDDPSNHLIFSPGTGRLVALDDRGTWSIRVFALNRQICVDGRRNAWIALESLVIRYAADDEHREVILRALSDFPFQGVRQHLRRVYDSPAKSTLLPASVIASIEEFPEVIGA